MQESHSYGEGSSTISSSIDEYVAIAMLVSVGTFLYVTTIHILPEVFMQHQHSHDHEHVTAVVNTQRDA
jgi:hypothetical protein